MIVTTVAVYVKPENIEDFIEASTENHKASIEEPGNMRFDVLQSMSDPTIFLLYEAYQSEEEAVAHKKTEHYLKWKRTVDIIERDLLLVPEIVIESYDVTVSEAMKPCFDSVSNAGGWSKSPSYNDKGEWSPQ